jgi:hypothetical protein
VENKEAERLHLERLAKLTKDVQVRLRRIPWLMRLSQEFVVRPKKLLVHLMSQGKCFSWDSAQNIICFAGLLELTVPARADCPPASLGRPESTSLSARCFVDEFASRGLAVHLQGLDKYADAAKNLESLLNVQRSQVEKLAEELHQHKTKAIAKSIDGQVGRLGRNIAT